ncbi:MAG: serine hydrolase domain-containing protein [Pseudomonadota bacterium]
MIFPKTAVTIVVAMLLFLSAPPGLAEPSQRPTLDLEYDALNGLDQALHDLVDTQQTGNLTYGIWQQGALIREGYFGPVNPSNDSTVTDDTIFSIQSMTKAITAVGILILTERGAIDLEDPITDILPEFEDVEVIADIGADGEMFTFRPPRPPTIRQLLSHTAGVGNARPSNNPAETAMFRANMLAARTIDEFIGIATSVPYIAAPGAEWNYSVSSDLQGAIIERVSGQRLGTFLQEVLFDPLGMRDTRFFVYRKDTDRLSGVLQKNEMGRAFSISEGAHNSIQSQTYHEGGHGLYSTQADYFRFLTFLLNQGRLEGRQILKPETLESLSINAIQYRGRPGAMASVGRRQGLGFGFGVGTIEDSVVSDMAAPEGAFYWYGALGSWFWVDPHNQIIFIAMTQTSSGMESDYIRESMRLVYGEPTPATTLYADTN